MRFVFILFVTCLFSAASFCQKKPLDHSVYDSWQSIGERSISNNGKYAVYTVLPQEGDGDLVVQSSDNSYKKIIPRGYGAIITEDSRFVVFKIRPLFKDTRESRIKKKLPTDMPKDSLGILELGKDSVLKFPRIKSFKLPEKGESVWLAYLSEKALPEPAAQKAKPDSATQVSNLLRMADSLARIADSIRNKVNEAKTRGVAVLQAAKKETPRTGAGIRLADQVEEGTTLVLRNLYTGAEKTFSLVTDFAFSKKGNILVIETSRRNSDSLSKATLSWMDLANGSTQTILTGFNEAKNFALDEEGTQLAFVAERDSALKALQKFYKLWYFRPGMDSAKLRVDRNSSGVTKGMTVSDNAQPLFSKDGKKLFFGLAPIRRVKDTTLVDFETARLDVWHYNDDYLQPQQLVQLNNELRRSYLAVLNTDDNKVIALGAEDAENVTIVNEGNADFVLASSTRGSRVEAQWQGFAKQTAYLVSTRDGSRKIVKEKIRAFFNASPNGKYISWYDAAAKNYFTYNVGNGAIKNITQKITVPLYDDEDDHPDDPPSFGTVGWIENDEYLLVNDRYDIWKVDPDGIKPPVNVTGGYGKKTKTILKYIRTDREERSIKANAQLLMDGFNRTSKYDGFFTKKLDVTGDPVMLSSGPYSVVLPLKAKSTDQYLITRMTPQESPNVYSTADLRSFTRLSEINLQQKDYNWLTSELIRWKMFDGKESEGLLFKPENFDPKKKYPVIFYFYEQDADGLYNYRAPAPSASTINIAYFVSNGYIVVDPNIHYKNGEPGESAYNSVVSVAKYMSKFPWVDSTKLAIQGQSWGGYQVAYLVTRTKMFAAAGAGAPVANMTSAYGGIRWQSGLNRQFQYERTQSRIGATLWQKPELYIKNSPLFKADKISTPVLIMHNDADGAVPWYQGIEFFTALRRLNKKVWMLEYNGEDHNLVERRNRKDLSIRLAQYFDHFLKGAPAAKWLAEGVPATLKGIDWGTGIEEEKKAF
jgi:dipeptidyl aminopeptidase/acylaminoacyl peptidase